MELEGEGVAAKVIALRARTPQVNKWVVAGTVLTGTFMAVLDSSIVNVALSNMSGSLGASLSEITWVVTGYILAQVIVMPIIGMLSERFGRKRLYFLSCVLFTVASMACGLAPTLWSMVFFRMIQGIGGGVLMTASQAILRESFPVEEQGTAMGIYGLGAVLAPSIGPTLGGWLVDHLSWPWIFYINVPVGIVTVFLVSRFLHDPPYLVRSKAHIDAVGLATMALGLGAFQLMLAKGEAENWFESRFIVGLALVSALALVAFVLRELEVDRPAVDLRILKNASFASATIMGGLLGAGLNGSLFLLPLYLQRLLGYPAMDAGLALMPRSLAMAVLMPIGGRMYNRIGPRTLVGSGLVVSAYSFWLLSHLTSHTGYWDIFFPQLLQGVGFSLVFVALSTAALGNIPKARMTAATGLYNVVRQVAGSVGIAAAASELSSSTVRLGVNLRSHIPETSPIATAWLSTVEGGIRARGVDSVGAHAIALRLLAAAVTREAQVLAYNHVFQIVAGMFLVVAPLVFFLQGHRAADAIEVAAEWPVEVAAE